MVEAYQIKRSHHTFLHQKGTFVEETQMYFHISRRGQFLQNQMPLGNVTVCTSKTRWTSQVLLLTTEIQTRPCLCKRIRRMAPGKSENYLCQTPLTKPDHATAKHTVTAQPGAVRSSRDQEAEEWRFGRYLEAAVTTKTSPKVNYDVARTAKPCLSFSILLLEE